MSPVEAGLRAVWCALLFFTLWPPAVAFAQQQPLEEVRIISDTGAPTDQPHTIRSIEIVVIDVWDNTENFLYQGLNSIKINTQEDIVRRELLFEEGETYDSFVIAESLRNLRSIRFLRDPRIRSEFDGKYVDITVYVQDTWTLIPQFSLSAGDGQEKLAAGIAESNLLGRGKRLELLYEEDDNRESVSAVYDSRRFMGENADLILGVFDRNDGEQFIASLEKPFRTLLDSHAWIVSNNVGDTIGRLFENGDERFIFRRERVDLNASLTFSRGEPSEHVYRYTFGYRYLSEDFSPADLDDYEALDLDPAELITDPSLVADDRRFSGPVFSLASIEADFVARNYVDRFDRIEDYNLGLRYGFSAQVAPEILGSKDDAMLLGTFISRGLRLGDTAFGRGELNISGRYQDGSWQNSLVRTELNYYHPLGSLDVLGLPLGQHTVAARFLVDYGTDLDRDRELLVGGDNFLRGYEAGTFTGDKRIGVNLEERVFVAENVWDLLNIGFAGFFDAGAASQDSLSEMLQDQIYSNIGLGLRIGFPRSSGQRVLRLEVAFPLREGPDGSGEFEPRILLSGGQLFSSRLTSETAGSERASAEIGFDR